MLLLLLSSFFVGCRELIKRALKGGEEKTWTLSNHLYDGHETIQCTQLIVILWILKMAGAVKSAVRRDIASAFSRLHY